MGDSSTNHDALADVLAGPEGVVLRDGDRYSLHRPLEHRKPGTSAEIWLDAERRISVCCHDSGRNRALMQHIVGSQR